MNAWSKLPNAKHIDWVLESIRSNYDIWIQAYEQAYIRDAKQTKDQTGNQARKQAYEQSVDHAWRQVLYQARGQAREQAYEQAYNRASNQAWFQISSVLLALVAYDDCDQYLSMTYNELKTWAVLSEKPQAVLLLPMAYVKEQLNECLV